MSFFELVIMAVDDDSLLQTSQFHSWIGIVAADKKPNDVFIDVMIPELTPVATGQVGVASSKQSVKLTDIGGRTINSTVTTGNTVRAYYIGGNTNVKYPPDVVRGEQVRVTRLANADRYYWDSMGRDDQLRKTELYRIEVANRKVHEDPTDDGHTYSFELDTRVNQHIRLQTSKRNGEKFTYVLKLDAKKGQVQLSDDVGNSLLIDSANTKVLLRNNKESFVLLNGPDITIAAPRDVTIKAGRQMLVTSPLMTLDAAGGSGVMALKATEIAQSAKSAITLTSPAIGLNGAVQVPLILTATLIRAVTYTNGALGPTYKSATHDLASGTGASGGVTPDTAAATSQRHATAWEDFDRAMTLIAECFRDVSGRLGVPVQYVNLPPISQDAKMTNLQGS